METTETSLQRAEETELSSINLFANKDLFEHGQRVALMLSKSELVPKKYQNNPGNCLIALEIAGRIKASPLMVMQNLDVILGKPSWSSKFLIASINSCGKFSPLRYEEDEQNGGRTRAWVYDKATKEKLYGEWVSMDMAKSEGWIDKSGSKWKTMPGLMRRYRAASFFVNQFAPEISMGFQTQDEVQDVEYVELKDQPKDYKEQERIILLINASDTIDELDKLKLHFKCREQWDAYDKRKIELTEKA